MVEALVSELNSRITCKREGGLDPGSKKQLLPIRLLLDLRKTGLGVEAQAWNSSIQERDEGELLISWAT